MGEVAVEVRRDAETGDNAEHRAQDHVVPTEAPAPKTGTAAASATMGPTMKNHSKVISPLPFPFSARSGLGPRRGCSVTGSLLTVEADNAPHLLSK